MLRAEGTESLARIGADTRPEMRLRSLVHGMGFRYRLHRRDLPGTPDLVFPARRVNQEPLSLKTSTVCCLATEAETSRSYSRSWMNSGMVWRGVSLTLRTSESPSNAVGSTLLPCIETREVPERYYLSPNAARGMLRRTDDQGRNLPPSFRQSLEILAKGR